MRRALVYGQDCALSGLKGAYEVIKTGRQSDKLCRKARKYVCVAVFVCWCKKQILALVHVCVASSEVKSL